MKHKLTTREENIAIKRFIEGRKLEDIAKEMKITRQRVAQIEREVSIRLLSFYQKEQLPKSKEESISFPVWVKYGHLKVKTTDKRFAKEEALRWERGYKENSNFRGFESPEIRIGNI